MITALDEIFMRRCFELARRGKGNTASNPMVGAVIVHNNKIIGEGYHKKYGEAHAEVNAVNNAKQYHHLLSSSTIYVSLEPCCFQGKTPACTSLILKHKIPKVVISALDQSPEVSGKGVAILKNAGVEVITGVLEKEGEQLANTRSIYVKHNRPYIILKYAQSKDRFMGKKNEQVWISNLFAKRLVHKWRAETDAIMVGTNTAAIDDPALTNRLFYGKTPTRIVLDRKGKLAQNLKLFDGEAKTYVVSETERKGIEGKNVELVNMTFDEELLPNLLRFLHEQKIGNLIVEGGKRLLESFIEANLWDEALVFTSNQYLKDGIVAPRIPQASSKQYQLIDNQLNVYYNTF